MKLDSKYFDSVRVKPDHEKVVRRGGAGLPVEGLQRAGLHRAPRGRGREGQYYLLCLDHVREFNASYNYFQGMSNADVEAYQKDSVTGHRPTWKVGANSWAHGTRHGMAHASSHGRALQRPAWRFSPGAPAAADGDEPRRALKPLELKSLEALDLARRRRARRDQGALQGAGQAPPPRCQWRGQKVRGQVARNHPSL